MTLDLAQFRGAFFEESFEALDAMEAALLKLDVGRPEAELINTIFRVAHSIKGGSATFGFSDIASFTHSLETLLDALRSGTMQVTAAISELLLRSVDLMREMLRAVEAQRPVDAQRVSDLQFDIELQLARRPAAAPAPSVAAPAAPLPAAAGGTREATAPASGAAAGSWAIVLRPGPDALVRGSDPLNVLRELAELGPLTVRTDRRGLPGFADLEPTRCQLGWEAELAAEVTEATLRQYFEFLDDDCDVQLQYRPARQAPGTDAADGVDAGIAERAPEPLAAAAAAGPAPTGAPADAPAAPPAAPAPAATAPAAAESGSIRVGVEKVDHLLNTVGELVITQAMLSQLEDAFEGPAAERLRAGLAQLERHTRELQDAVMRVRMLPISFVFSRFPRMVRDLAQRLDKQVELRLTGEQTELDKTVLEKIGDPLVHLVRNAIDHGIETPAARSAAGKPRAGVIHLHAYHRSGNIVVEVSDDGRGLDRTRILEKARARGLVAPDLALSDEAVDQLIFLPGFSTAEEATDVSGRGVGMDVVRRNVKELGGDVELHSDPGHGTRCRITLPLTLAIVDGQTVAVGAETYIVPLVSIIESIQIGAQGASRHCGPNEVFSFRGEYLPVVRLHRLFGIEPRSPALQDGLIVVTEGDGRRVGLFVDQLLGQQQVVIKSLETNYGQVEGISGATILGDGSVGLIVDVSAIIRAASMRAAA